MAGNPVAKPAPNGLEFITNFGGGSKKFGKVAGLTRYKSNLVAPKFAVSKKYKRIGYKVEHYAVVQKTSSEDATHLCYYPGPGDHVWPGMPTAEIGGKIYTHYLHVTDHNNFHSDPQ